MFWSGCIPSPGLSVLLLTLTIILWEVVDQMRVHDLLLQQVLLVEEQND